MVSDKRRSIWKYIKKYKFNSIFVYNLLLISLLVMLPFTVISIAVYYYYYDILKENIGIANLNALSKITDLVDMKMREAEELSIRIASDREVEALLMRRKTLVPDYNAIEKMNNIINRLNVYMFANDHIHSIYIYSDRNDHVLTVPQGGSKFSNFFDRCWHYLYLDKRKVLNSWIDVRMVNMLFSDDTHRFITIFQLTPIYGQSENGVVIINIDIDKFRKLVNGTREDTPAKELFVINQNGKIIYNNNDSSIIGENINQIDILSNILPMISENPAIMDIDGVKKIVSVTTSDYNEWRYISITPLTQYDRKLDNLMSFMIILIIMGTITGCSVAFLISVKTFKPFENILHILESSDDLISSPISNLRENSSGGADVRKTNMFAGLNEIKYIVSSILRSFDKNKKLEEESKLRLDMLKKAQNIALQSQINPHFLHNTLETINWKAIELTNNENEVSFLIASLSEFIRLSQENDNDFTTIRVDIEQAKRYVDIQNIRYKNLFEVIWDIDSAMLDCMTVKMTLQPFIENAIYHGIKPKKVKGIIKVDGYIENDLCILNVTDDGMGMSKENIDKINNDLKDNYEYESRHIGIKNVNQRIKLIFGEKYGLTLDSNIKGGIIVKITIPKLTLFPKT